MKKLSSVPFQRVYHYLKQFSEEKSLDNYIYSPSDVVIDPSLFIEIVLR